LSSFLPFFAIFFFLSSVRLCASHFLCSVSTVFARIIAERSGELGCDDRPVMIGRVGLVWSFLLIFFLRVGPGVVAVPLVSTVVTASVATVVVYSNLRTAALLS
jgi:hypothetical protein